MLTLATIHSILETDHDRRDVHSKQREVTMHDASLFLPDTICDSLRANLASGLRAIADALDAQELDGKFIGASAAAGGRYDDRLHLRIVLDVAAPIIGMIAPEAFTLKLEEVKTNQPQLSPASPEIVWGNGNRGQNSVQQTEVGWPTR